MKEPTSIELPPVNPGEGYVSQIIEAQERDARLTVLIGAGTMATGLAVAGVEASGVANHTNLRYEMPFEKPVQNVINGIDGNLAHAGDIVVPAALLATGILKVATRKSNSAEVIDNLSSSELSDGGKRQQIWRRALVRVGAGSVPILAAAGAFLGTFSAAIGTEVTNGPDRPIEALAAVAPGDNFIVQYPGAKPMVESSLTPGLIDRVEARASQEGVRATPFNLALGDITANGQLLTSLSVGLRVPEEGFPVSWKSADGCKDIPVLVDRTARIADGTVIDDMGAKAHVVGSVENVSAINRVGVVMSEEAMATCLKKDEGNMHAVVLDTKDANQASEILAAANTKGEIATVITREHYLKNSEEFWRSNVKPITNVLSLVSFAFAGVAMAGSMGARLFRNRREWSNMLANGDSMATVRATEFFRSLKDGIIALSGVVVAAAATPLVNVTESGLKAGTSVKEWAIGGAIAILGPVMGSMVRVVRPGKLIDKRDGTQGA